MSTDRRGVVLQGRAREIICNVDEYFESVKQHNLKLIDQLKAASIVAGPSGNVTVTRETFALIMQTLQNASKVSERVRLATGINKNTLTRIRREKREAQASCSKLTSLKKSNLELDQIKKEVQNDKVQNDEVQNDEVQTSTVFVAGLPSPQDMSNIIEITIKSEIMDE